MSHWLNVTDLPDGWEELPSICGGSGIQLRSLMGAAIAMYGPWAELSDSDVGQTPVIECRWPKPDQNVTGPEQMGWAARRRYGEVQLGEADG